MFRLRNHGNTHTHTHTHTHTFITICGNISFTEFSNSWTELNTISRSLFLTGHSSPVIARACQLLAGLTSTCPQSEVNEHLASLGMICGQYVESPAVVGIMVSRSLKETNSLISVIWNIANIVTAYIVQFPAVNPPTPGESLRLTSRPRCPTLRQSCQEFIICSWSRKRRY